MSAPLTLDAMRDLVPGYALGTLSIEETRSFEIAMMDAALAAVIAPELVEHRRVVEQLQLAYVVSPDPSLKARVLAQLDVAQRAEGGAATAPQAVLDPLLAATHAGGSTTRSGTPHASHAAVGRVSGESTRMPPQVPARRSPARGGRAGWYAAAVLGAALAASVALVVDSRNDNAALTVELRAQAAIAKRDAAALADRERTLATLLDGGNDLTLVQLTANAARGPALQLFWNTREGRGVVRATGLRQIAADRAYCLWIIRDGKPAPVKLFQIDAAGRATLTDVVLPTTRDGVAAFAVTEEPAAGSPIPTMTPFLLGEVRRQ